VSVDRGDDMEAESESHSAESTVNVVYCQTCGRPSQSEQDNCIYCGDTLHVASSSHPVNQAVQDILTLRFSDRWLLHVDDQHGFLHQAERQYFFWTITGVALALSSLVVLLPVGVLGGAAYMESVLWVAAAFSLSGVTYGLVSIICGLFVSAFRR
jgi:hypothetical protein